MTWTNRAIAAAVSIGCAFASLSVVASDAEWVDIMGNKALRALYSNKTFRGKDDWGKDWVGHYRSDGKGVLITGGLRYPRTWKVASGDQVCVTEERGTTCFRLQRHSKVPNKIKAHNLRQNHFSEFTVEDGIPKF